MPSPFLWVTAALALAAAAPGDASARRGRPREPKPLEWVERFHVEPRLDLLPRMIVLLDREGALSGAERARLAGFFSVIFRRPDVQAPLLVNTSMVGPGGRATLVEALWLSGQADAAQRIARSRGADVAPWRRTPPDLRAQRIDTSYRLELAWGAFLASGDPAYPRKVVDVLDRHPPSGLGRQPWLHVSALARASLLEEARRHPAVLALLREEARTRTGRARPALERILAELETQAAVPAP